MFNAAAVGSAAAAATEAFRSFSYGDSKNQRKRMRASGSTKGSRRSTKARFTPIMGRPVKMSNVIPKTLHTYFSSHATAYVVAGSTGAFYMDVQGNNMHQPWAWTHSYDTVPWYVSQATPSSTTLGYHGLNQVLGAGSCYDSYCVDQFTLEVQVIPASPVDNGYVSIVPYKYFESTFDASLPTSLSAARRVIGAKNGVFSNDDPQRKLKFTFNVAQQFGMPKAICENDEKFQSRYGGSPDNYANCRILLNNAQGAATTNNISVSIKLTARVKLFNTDNTAINAAVV